MNPTKQTLFSTDDEINIIHRDKEGVPSYKIGSDRVSVTLVSVLTQFN